MFGCAYLDNKWPRTRGSRPEIPVIVLEHFDSSRFSALFGIVVACYILQDVVQLIDSLVRDAFVLRTKKVDG